MSTGLQRTTVPRLTAFPRKTWVAVVLLLALQMVYGNVAAAEEDRKPDSQAAAAEVQDLLFLAQDRILVLRLQIEVDGAPFRDPWRKRLAGLFELADRNRDGQLSDEEWRSPPAADSAVGSGGRLDELRSILTSGRWEQADLDPCDGALSFPEFAAVVAHRQGEGPFQSSAATLTTLTARPAPNGRLSAGAILFQSLDRDHDSQLSEQELREAPAALHRCDFDGDGAASIDELTHTRNPFSQANNDRGSFDGTPIVVLAPQTEEREVGRTLLRIYGREDRAGNRTIPAKLFGIPEAELPKYDEDGDGSLDPREVRTFLARPIADVELVLRVGTRGEQAARAELIRVVSSPDFSARMTPLGFVLVTLGDQQLEVSVSSSERTFETMQAALTSQFKGTDADGNGYIEPMEGARSPFFRDSFRILDRDGDGKIFEAEMGAAVEEPIHAGLSRTRMTTNDLGKDLFQILDANRDERLSDREQRVAITRFALWDVNGDASLSEAEVPHLYQLVLQRGLPNLPGFEDPDRSRPRPDAAGPPAGPDWFRKMDRNGDGDVAEIEFLGNAAQFRKMDRDGNSLIDADEASLSTPRP